MSLHCVEPFKGGRQKFDFYSLSIVGEFTLQVGSKYHHFREYIPPQSQLGSVSTPSQACPGSQPGPSFVCIGGTWTSGTLIITNCPTITSSLDYLLLTHLERFSQHHLHPRSRSTPSCYSSSSSHFNQHLVLGDWQCFNQRC